MTGRPLVGVFLTHANDLLGPDLARLGDVVRRLDDAGVDYLTVADHIVLGPDLSAHDALGGGTLGYPLTEPYPEPLVTLAAIAAVTTRIRLLTGVLVAPLRPPALLAKSVATLAVLSGGRLELGVGSGWQEAEFAALGVPVTEKVARLDAGLAACRALWADESSNGLHCFPQPPGGTVPVWFAGRPTRATLRRVAETGAGWLPIRQLDPEAAAAARADLDRACDEAGRDPATVGIRCPLTPVEDWGALRGTVSRLWESGVDGVHLPLRRLATSLTELDAVLPRLTGLAA